MSHVNTAVVGTGTHEFWPASGPPDEDSGIQIQETFSGGVATPKARVLAPWI
jgi:hypothetical protein